MNGIDITFSDKRVRRMLKKRQYDQLPKATARALNRANTQTQTAARRELVVQLGIPNKTIRPRFFRRLVRKAKPDKPVASFVVGVLDVPVHKLSGTPRQTKHGARVGRRAYPGAFVQQIASHRGVFKRAGTGRYPIVHVVQEFTWPARRIVGRVVDEKAGGFFKKRMEHEIGRMVGR